MGECSGCCWKAGPYHGQCTGARGRLHLARSKQSMCAVSPTARCGPERLRDCLIAAACTSPSLLPSCSRARYGTERFASVAPQAGGGVWERTQASRPLGAGSDQLPIVTSAPAAGKQGRGSAWVGSQVTRRQGLLRVSLCPSSQDALHRLYPGPGLLHHMENQGSAAFLANREGGKVNCCVTMETGKEQLHMWQHGPGGESGSQLMA